MRKIKEILRLRYEVGLSNRQIARSCSMGRTAVADYLRRAAGAGLSWPLPEDMDETRMERLLFPPPVPSVNSVRITIVAVTFIRGISSLKAIQLFWEKSALETGPHQLPPPYLADNSPVQLSQ